MCLVGEYFGSKISWLKGCCIQSKDIYWIPIMCQVQWCWLRISWVSWIRSFLYILIPVNNLSSDPAASFHLCLSTCIACSAAMGLWCQIHTSWFRSRPFINHRLCRTVYLLSFFIITTRNYVWLHLCLYLHCHTIW